MKKAFFLVAVATITLFSCQKEIETNDVKPANDGFTFKASIEALSDADTKATINASNKLVWATGDKIGVYVTESSWTDKNQPFTLSSGEGSSEGEFAWDYTGEFPSSAAAAFFPWQGTGTDKNNVYTDNVYFKLPNAYWSYDSGKMLTPLVAKLSGSTDPINFKHAGAAVKVTTNNLVSGTYHATMSVTGKQITGDFHVQYANAGSDAMELDAAEDASKNNVTLHAWKSSGPFTWIFPVPALTKPKLQFVITDDNGIPVWSKNLKAQANDLNRGDILVFPALDTPYEKFVQDDAHKWSFSGNINGGSWQDNVPMVSDGKYWILAGCTFAAGDEFKIRKDEKWAFEGGEEYPSDNWKFNDGNAGAKDIIFNSVTKEITVVAHSFAYPESFIPSPSMTISIDGTMSDWDACKTESTNSSNNYRVFKATYDKDYIYLYTKRVTKDGQQYIYYDFDLDNNSSTGTSEGSRTGLEAYTALALYNGTTINENPVGVSDCNYPDTGVYANVYCKGTVGTEFTETELRIPRSNLGINKGDTIKIYSWGNKSADGVASHPITLRIGN